MASQQAITAVGGLMQNPCGNADASLLFETSTDFGGCATDGTATGTGGSAPAAGTGGASQQAVTAIGGLMQNPCGSAAASLLFETSTDFGTCATGTAGGTGTSGGVEPGQIGSQQAITAVGGLEQNPCGNAAWSLLFETSTDFGSCTPADAASGQIGSQQAITILGGMEQNACGNVAWSLLFETSTDFGTCGGSSSPGGPNQAQLTTTMPTVNGQDAGTPPGPQVATGQQATIVVPVANTGSVTVTHLSGSSPDGTVTCTSDSLAPGESASCSMTLTTTQGEHTVGITITGTDTTGQTISVVTPVFFTGTAPQQGQGQFTIGTPKVNGQPAGSAPGPDVTEDSSYTVTVTVTNSGSGTVTGITGTTSVGTVTGPTSLAAGASAIYMVTGTSVGGPQSVQLRFTGTAPDGGTVTSQTVFYYTGQTPGGGSTGRLTVDSPMVDGQPAGGAPGPDVPSGTSYTATVKVTNTGSGTVTGIAGTTSAGTVTGPSSLAAGKSATYTFTGTSVTGPQTVTVSFDGTGPDDSAVTASGTLYYTGQTPGGTGGQLTVGTPTVNGQPAGSAPGPDVPQGSSYTVTVKVTNSGTTPVTGLSGTSSVGTVTGPVSLAPGTSGTYTMTGTSVAGPQSVQIVFAGTGPGGGTVASSTVVYYTGQTPGGTGGQLTVGTPTVNGQPAGSAPGPNVPQGSSYTVTVKVTNSGSETVTGISGTTPVGTVTGPSSLAAGKSGTYTFTGTSVAGPQTVTVSFEGTGPDDSPVTATGTVYYTGQTPGGGSTGELTVGTPTVNGQPAGSAPGPNVPEGSSYTVTVKVTNTGSGTVTGIAGTTSVGTVTGPSSLAAGKSGTYTFTGTSVPGPQTVTVSFDGTGPDDSPIAASGTVYYTGQPSGSGSTGRLTVGSPTVNGQPAGSAPGPSIDPGSSVTVTVTVKDSGNTNLTGLSGTSTLGTVTCATSTLTPGQSTTCQVSGTAPATPGPQLVPIVVAAANPTGGDVGDIGMAYYTTGPITSSPGGALTVGSPTVNDKPAGSAPGPDVDPGSSVTVTVTVEDSGDTDLTGLSGTSTLGTVTCATDSLTPGQSTTCQVTGTAATTPGSQVVPIVVAAANPTGGYVANGTLAFYTAKTTGNGTLTVTEQQINGKPADSAPGPDVPEGSSYTATVTVTNTGSGTVTGISGTTPVGTVTGPSSLAAGKSAIYTFTGTSVAGPQTVTVSFTGTGPDDSPVTASGTLYYTGQKPGGGSAGKLTVDTPTVNGQPAGSAPGPDVPSGTSYTATVKVTNTSSGTVTGITGTTPVGTVTGPSSLAAGKSATYTFTATSVTGSQTVTVSFTGTGPDDNPVTASGTLYYTGQKPGGGSTGQLTVDTPTVNGQPAGSAPGPNVPEGSSYTATVKVTNTGSGTVTGISGTTPVGTVTGPSSLAAGKSATYTFTSTSVAGSQTMTVSFTGTGPDDSPVTASGTLYYTGQTSGGQNPGTGQLTLGTPAVNGTPAGSAPGPDVAPSSTVTVTVTVKNSGGVALTQLAGTSTVGAVSCAKTSLAVGESTTCTVSGSSPDSANPQVAPIVIAAVDPDRQPVAASAIAYYTVTGTAPTGGPLRIGTPTVNGQPAGSAPGPDVAPGSTITVIVPVTNTTEATVTDVGGTSPAGTFTGPSSLAPGTSGDYRLVTVAGSGTQSIPVTFQASDPSGGTVSSSRDVYYSGTPAGAGNPGGNGGGGTTVTGGRTGIGSSGGAVTTRPIGRLPLGYAGPPRSVPTGHSGLAATEPFPQMTVLGLTLLGLMLTLTGLLGIGWSRRRRLLSVVRPATINVHRRE